MASFDVLWRNHPARQTPPIVNPCDGGFTNQCVIRLGECFTKSGVDFSSFRGARCWHGHGRRHPLRVEEIKHWLDSDEAAFLPYYAEKSRRTKSGRQRSYHSYLGRRGVVVWRNFHGSGNQGDHVDLWNGSTVARGARDYFERSEEIWFWEMT